jgi:DNA-3-methyladenine glycosylase II
MVRAKLTARGEHILTRGPFDLRQSIAFAGGFLPAGQTGQDGHLHLAFVPDGEEHAVGVCVTPELDRLTPQVERILSLDVDASGFPEVGRRDAVVGRLQALYPGLRPVLFASPFEAAVWCVLSTRVQMRQAARVRERMAQELGEEVDIHGDRRRAFPAPSRLLPLERFQGLFGRKPEYLREIAAAARSGRLDAARLRAMPEEQARTEVRRLPGIGDFGSELILARGCGLPDLLPRHEPRVREAAALAYGWNEPSHERLAETAEGWRPFRSWVSFLLRRAYADGKL